MVKRIRNAKPSMIYVIELSSMHIKIGRSGRPEWRCRDFKRTAPFAKLLYHTEIRDDATCVESLIHKELVGSKAHNEVFITTPEIAINTVKKICEAMDKIEYFEKDYVNSWAKYVNLHKRALELNELINKKYEPPGGIM